MATTRNTNTNNTSSSPINLIVRLKNPWFWIGIFGVLATALDITPETVTTWESLWNSFIVAIQNPFTVFSAFIAVLGVFIDPTTAGVGDSTRALSYKTPKR